MKLFNVLSVLLATCVMVAGCGDDEITDPGPDPEYADVLFFHGAEAAGSVKLQVGNAAVVSDRAFSIVHDDYVHVEEGAREVKVVMADGVNTLASGSLTFVKDEFYTLFIVNDSNDVYDLLLFEDDLTEPAAGKAHIRMANLVPDAPGVKLAVPGSGQGPIISNIKFKDVSEMFTAVNAGTATYRVQDAATSGGGGGGGGGNAGLIDDIPLTFEEGKIYTLALVGRLSDNTATLVVIPHSHGE